MRSASPENLLADMTAMIVSVTTMIDMTLQLAIIKKVPRHKGELVLSCFFLQAYYCSFLLLGSFYICDIYYVFVFFVHFGILGRTLWVVVCAFAKTFPTK